jgi:hypothetical protein
MTSISTSHFELPAFAPGQTSAADSPEPSVFLEETEVSLHRLHRHVQQTLGELPSSASDLPEGVSEGQSEPNQLFYLITLLAIVAGAILVVFTGF